MCWVQRVEGMGPLVEVRSEEVVNGWLGAELGNCDACL